MTTPGPFEIAKVAINYASYLYFLAAPPAVWIAVERKGFARIAAATLFLGLTLLAYARFVEPRMLLMVAHDIDLAGCFAEAGEARLAVFSDTHIGPFRYSVPLARIAAQVKAEKPDAVLIAGDFVSYLPEEDFDEAFAPLGDMGAPVYAVLGNHDVGLPGPDVGAALRASLTRIGVAMIDDESVALDGDSHAFELIGVSDLWAENQKLSLFDAPAAGPRLALTHNPETMLEIAPAKRPDLLIAGHTHGGQIYLPLITCRFTFACTVAKSGYLMLDGGAVFVTSGTGQSMLPMRFLAPPRIDVLNVRYKRCADA
ncbi:MAG: metallophosphoesterase [Hyphococcus sp.]